MKYTLRVYFERSLFEFITPNINNRVISIDIPKDISGSGRIINIPLEIFDGQWKVLSTKDQYLRLDDVRVDAIELSKGILFYWVSDDEFAIPIMVEELNPSYTRFNKFRLHQSSIKIGSSQDNQIVYSTMNVISGHHAVIDFRNGSYWVRDLKSQNGVYVNDHRISGECELHFGDRIDIFGLKIILFQDIIAINQPSDALIFSGFESTGIVIKNKPIRIGNERLYQRSPRRLEKVDDEVIEIEAPPASNKQRRPNLVYIIGPSVTMVIPMTAGVIFTLALSNNTTSANPMMFMGIITSATAALIGGFWAILNYRYQHRMEKEDAELRSSKYAAYLLKMRGILETKHKNNQNILINRYPDLDKTFNLVKSRDRRIFERNLNHSDFLNVRIGLGDWKSPNLISVPKERFTLLDDHLVEEPRIIKKEFENLKNVPVCVNLAQLPLIGVIAGQKEKVHQIAESMIAQIATYHSYHDVKIVYIYDEDNQPDTDFIKWLPHIWSSDEKIRFIGSNSSAIADIFYHLFGVIRERSEASLENNLRPAPHYVVFVSNPEIIQKEGFEKILTTNDTRLGITTILLYQSIEKLPNHCTTIIQHDEFARTLMSLDNQFEPFENISFDFADKQELMRYSKLISRIRLNEHKVNGSLPQMLTFLDMYKTSTLDEIDIYRNWLQNRSFESMKALIGVKRGNVPMFLDIHEKFHGPHGLIAGTTGSGKSETIQTYILSLAMNYHPHEVAFILIDYKGGGMANSFISLPHLAGIITNLGGNQTNRALMSINSEIKRRQSIFNEVKVKHIDEYIELYRNEKVVQPLPHLIIIADEFAELKKEQPDFVRALVSASRIGRSLGVHLILATQKPSGVVDDEIWGNSKFRICLRVQDKGDSMEMLKRNEAAYITNPGRAYFQVGNNEIFEEFQSGWSGAEYSPLIPFTEEDENVVEMINLWGKSAIIKGAKKPIKGLIKTEKQLQMAVTRIANLSAEHHIKKINDIWLDPLPSTIYLADLDPDFDRLIDPKEWLSFRRSLPITIGKVDDPINQTQFAFKYDLLESGHLMIVGSSLSGKTTLLQTILYSLARKYSPANVNFYLFDFGSRMLRNFKKLPHTGIVVSDEELDLVDRVFNTISKEMVARKQLFSDKGIGTYKEYAKVYKDKPAIVCAIDNLVSLLENKSDVEDRLIQLSREAASYGIYLIVTLTSLNDVRSRLRQYFMNGIGLQLADRYEYENVVGEKLEMTADEHIAGRGIAKGNRSLEFQAAISFKVDFSEINNEYSRAFEEISALWSGTPTLTIPVIPDDLTVDNFIQLNKEMIDSSQNLPVGYDLNEAIPLSLDLGHSYCLTIGGGPRTGKTNLLKFWMSVAQQRQSQVVLFDSASQDLKNYVDQLKIKHYLTLGDQLYKFFEKTLIPEFSARSDAKKDSKLASYKDATKQIFFFISDMNSFMDSIYNHEKNMKGFFEQALQVGAGLSVYFIGIVSNNDMTGEFSTKRALRSFIGYKNGIYMGSNPDQQRIFDIDMPMSERSKRMEIGCGFLCTDGRSVRVVTPVVSE